DRLGNSRLGMGSAFVQYSCHTCPEVRHRLTAGFAGGLPRPDAVRLAVALAQCGEFGFVLFSAAQAGGLMSSSLTALASVLITISMLTTPFLLRLVAHWSPSARESQAGC